MNKDENKFTLFAYEKNNIENRQAIYFIDKNGNKNKKTLLAQLDSITSKMNKDYLYKYLLEKGIIKKEYTEFVIFYNKKSKDENVIKQIPVIFNDYNIKMYSEYLLGNDDEDHKRKFKKLNDSIFWSFIDILDKESLEYDKLDFGKKQNYMNGNSYSARFSRLPFALSSLKKRVQDRILGFYQDNQNFRVKDNKKLLYSNSFGIQNDIQTSYRSFRDVYLFLTNNKINYEEDFKDLNCDDYDSLFNEKTDKNLKNEQKSQEKNKLIELKQKINKEFEIQKEYTIEDYLNLLNDIDKKESFNDFVYDSNLIPKKIKDYTNRIVRSFGPDDNENVYLESNIRQFNNSHPGVINKLINDYYKQKVNIKK